MYAVFLAGPSVCEYPAGVSTVRCVYWVDPHAADAPAIPTIKPAAPPRASARVNLEAATAVRERSTREDMVRAVYTRRVLSQAAQAAMPHQPQATSAGAIRATFLRGGLALGRGGRLQPRPSRVQRSRAALETRVFRARSRERSTPVVCKGSTGDPSGEEIEPAARVLHHSPLRVGATPLHSRTGASPNRESVSSALHRMSKP